MFVDQKKEGIIMADPILAPKPVTAVIAAPVINPATGTPVMVPLKDHSILYGAGGTVLGFMLLGPLGALIGAASGYGGRKLHIKQKQKAAAFKGSPTAASFAPPATPMAPTPVVKPGNEVSPAATVSGDFGSMRSAAMKG
jgi:hypothetical protein